MTMPNFLVIGAPRSGTTALYHYLSQHPQIFMSPVKEPHFFSFENEELKRPGPGHRTTNMITDIDAYRRLFRGVTDELAIGEASPSYIYHPRAVERIRHYVPDAKLIAILRDPVERAFSNFLQCISLGREPLSDFSEALRVEEARIEDNWAALWHYKRKGFYYEQLRRYYDVFDRDQIKVLLYEDLNEKPLNTLQDTFLFLGVDETFVPDMSPSRVNASGSPRSRILHSVFTGLNRPALKRAIPPGLLNALREPIKKRVFAKPPRLSAELSAEERGQLIEIFREDILNLQSLIDKDLSRWLEVDSASG